MKRVLEAEKAASPGKQRLYKSDDPGKSAAALSSDIENRITMLQTVDGRTRVPWNDLETIKARVSMYFLACAESHTFPTVAGLANRGLGVSKRRLNEFLSHSNSESAEFLQVTKDVIADIMVNSALTNHCNSIMAIFELKNSSGYRDSLELQATAPPPAAAELDPAELQRQLDALPDD